MCIKCKHCKTSDLGVIAKEIKTSPVRMTDGKIVDALAEPSVETKYEINYCFTCEKSITEKDLTDKEVCPVCNKEVDELVDGMCPDCKIKADEFSSMSKEELIIAFLKKDMEKKPVSRRRTTVKKPEEKTEEIQDNVVENKDIVQDKEPEENKEPKENIPAELKDEEIAKATLEMQEKVANSEAPSTIKNTTDQVIEDNVVAVTQNIDANVPAVNADDDLMSKLNALGNFDIGDAPF